MSARRLAIQIEPEWAGQPVNNLLRRRLGLSGTLLRRLKWLEDGILLDGVRVTTREIVRAGQTLSVRLSDPTVKSGIPPVSLPLDIVYEDRDIVIVNKAPGMPSYPGPGHWQDSLCQAGTMLAQQRLLSRYRHSGQSNHIVGLALGGKHQGNGAALTMSYHSHPAEAFAQMPYCSLGIILEIIGSEAGEIQRRIPIPTVIISQRCYAMACQCISKHGKRTVTKYLLVTVLLSTTSHHHHHRGIAVAVRWQREGTAEDNVAIRHAHLLGSIRERRCRSLRSPHLHLSFSEGQRQRQSSLLELSLYGVSVHDTLERDPNSSHCHP